MRPGDRPHAQHMQQRPRAAEHAQRHIADAMQQQRQRHRVLGVLLPCAPRPPHLGAGLRGRRPVQLVVRGAAQVPNEVTERGKTEALGGIAEERFGLVGEGAQHLGGIGLREQRRRIGGTVGVRLQDGGDGGVSALVRSLEEAVDVDADGREIYLNYYTKVQRIV